MLASDLFTRIAPAQSVGTYGPPAVSVEEANRRGGEALDRKDYASALNWFRKAAEQGNPEAQAKLGLMYYDGRGVKQSFAEALSWELKAAQQGHPLGQEVVGNMYRWGKGVTKDYAVALMWLRKAADQGSTNAQLALSAMYMRGEGVPQDTEKAMEWIQKAGAKKSSPVQASTIKADITLWCDQPTFGGGIVKSLVSIDTSSKYVKFETQGQGTVEYRDGLYGKVVTSGYMAPEAIDVQQFVTIENGSVRFGFTNKGATEVNSIELNTGIFRTGGRITQCTEAKARQ